jgi:hypothetical protein
MIVDMQGNPVTNFAPSTKSIEIEIDPRLEDERLEDFVNNYLVPFMQQLQVPVLKVNINE